mmetsp:Transcript_21060/g.69639  ORF Transcript_21060/g.69639 Transcript_21060/m.69639 type:complete len:390 (+) Transcript_21060:28-1197(+)
MSKIDSIYSALFDDEVFVMYGLESVEYEINQLQDAPDAYSLQLQLRRVLRALERCDRAALAAARPALDAVAPDATAPTLRPASVTWTRENRALLVSLVLHFYEADRLSALPRDLLSGAILAYVDAPALASLCAVSREAQSAAECDAAWHEPYERQFGAGGPLRFDFGASLKERYRQRLRDPSAGDRVEVAWQGRFRLEGLEVYRGLAWWAAEVAEKAGTGGSASTGVAPAGGATAPRTAQARSRRRGPGDDVAAGGDDAQLRRYKVHYLNWDARWDEWVTREQLRWPVHEGKTSAIAPGDDVEVWCSGNTVPGAWLRAVVASVEDDLYCVGNVASSGRLWVKRDRVRLVRKAPALREGRTGKLSALGRALSEAARLVHHCSARLLRLRG